MNNLGHNHKKLRLVNYVVSSINVKVKALMVYCVGVSHSKQSYWGVANIRRNLKGVGTVSLLMHTSVNEFNTMSYGKPNEHSKKDNNSTKK